MTSGCISKNGAPTQVLLNHKRERKNKENANFVHIMYLLAKLCNIFDEAFFIDVSIYLYFMRYLQTGLCSHRSRLEA